ncbi:type I polyketide synthase, partial [Streptomyces phaeochromogenes]
MADHRYELSVSGPEAEAIAIVGMSCRLPQAPGIEAFWRLLHVGTSAITEVPEGRWPDDAFLDVDLSDVERRGLRWGGFLDSVDGFDAAFFGISPREASVMDPQQRLMLELAWEALEDAGTAPQTLADQRTGVFVGAASSDYAVLLDRQGPGARTSHANAGTQHSIIANRVSYFLGFQGPSLAVDAGQSSSLVAVHMACESLRNGESTVALAGGVNLNLLPDSALAVARFGALSPDGRCHTFDARANGYVRGEGGGLVVLKPLSRAVADGDRVYCVIRGSAVNNDGGGQGLTVPSRAAQEEVIRLACDRAGVLPGELGYVELHGTGTRVGDPVEAAALGAVAGAGAGRDADAPLVVGSAKTNVGHLEAAAGVVGLMKTALCLSRGELVRSLNFDTPNPEIPLGELRLRVSAENSDWEGSSVAGVSSFGMGGTNCHVVLTSEPQAVDGHGTGTALPGGVVPLVVSGRSAAGLAGQAGRLREFLESGAGVGVELAEVGRSLVMTRAGLEHRAVVLAADRGEAVAGLAAVAAGEPAARVVSGVVVPGGVGMVFSGQGAQRLGMGRELAAEFGVFGEVFGEVCGLLDGALAGAVPFGVRDVVWAVEGSEEAGWLGETVYTQAGLFAFEVALARLWQSWGVVPGVVAGHSVGEIAAAHVAGVLSLSDAVAVVAARGLLMQGLEPGAMASVAAPVQWVEAAIERWHTEHT